MRGGCPCQHAICSVELKRDATECRLSTLPNLCFWLCSATDKQQTNNLQSIKEPSTLLQPSRGSGGGKKGSKWKDRDGDETQTKNRDASGCYRWHHGVGVWLYVNFLGTCWCVASTTVCGDFKAHRDLFVFNFSIDLLSPPARNHWPFLLLGLVGLESIFQMLNCSEEKVATSCHLRLLCRPRHKSCAESKNLPASSTNSWIQELTHFFLSFFLSFIWIHISLSSFFRPHLVVSVISLSNLKTKETK